jgi:hypothetical protein
VQTHSSREGGIATPVPPTHRSQAYSATPSFASPLVRGVATDYGESDGHIGGAGILPAAWHGLPGRDCTGKMPLVRPRAEPDWSRLPPGPLHPIRAGSCGPGSPPPRVSQDTGLAEPGSAEEFRHPGFPGRRQTPELHACRSRVGGPFSPAGLSGGLTAQLRPD